MVVTCSDTECKYYNPKGCQAPGIDHTADRFCITGRRKPRDDIKRLMRASEPKGYKKSREVDEGLSEYSIASWMFEHPWMTFFVLITLADSIGEWFRK